MSQNVKAFIHRLSFDAHLSVLFHLPSSEGPSPCVVFVHGFASNRSGHYRLAYDLSSQLADVGIASIRFDMRGCGDSSGSFANYCISSQVEDLEAIYALIEDHASFDATRCVFLGRSLGALIACLTAQKHPQLAGLVLWNPFFSQESWSQMPDAIFGNVLGERMRQELAVASVREVMPALSHIPLLQVHSMRDEVLSALHRESYVSCRDVPLENDQILLLSESNHFFARLQDRARVLEETFRWLTHLLIGAS